MLKPETAAKLIVPPKALRRARLTLSRHAECFWTRQPSVPVVDRNDVELVIRRLRENGRTAAWRTALRVEACL
jgi:hypothetical protein